MLLTRFLLTLLLAVATVVIAVTVDLWWLTVLALLILVTATISVVRRVLHYTAAPDWSSDWMDPEDEAELQNAGLVEQETGLPTHHRWHARQSRRFAEQVAHGGVTAVPAGWRGPDGAHRVLLIASAPVSFELLRSGLADHREPDELAVLVVPPTLTATAAAYRLGDLTEAIEHAEWVARETVDRLRAAGVHAACHIGPEDPAVAVCDGLRTYDAELVLVARHRHHPVRHLEDVPVAAAAEPFGVPVRELELDAVPA